MSSQDAVPLPWHGEPYSVKRHGVRIDNCDSEPIQTPGCIQSHGALLVLRGADRAILQVSENAERLLGAAPEALLGQPAALVVGTENAALIEHHLRTGVTDHNPIYLFTLAARGTVPSLDATLHTTSGLVVLELEPALETPKADAPDYYRLLKKSVAALQTTHGLLDYCKAVTEAVRELTTLDRVMIYRFHEDGHGEVIAESARADLPS